ncbi:unnamed protein product [Cyprideis torosa]|uniref:RNA helicase n=1 Tax=Cyprideis torosa TaxID=163714 RepID=A0A7R8ZKK5_9CRUS|nr:unnamed protein product [Cyprideis torosa]CAG0889590.1 unnamed protein product [Cyprideis torosa]
MGEIHGDPPAERTPNDHRESCDSDSCISDSPRPSNEANAAGGGNSSESEGPSASSDHESPKKAFIKPRVVPKTKKGLLKIGFGRKRKRMREVSTDPLGSIAKARSQLKARANLPPAAYHKKDDPVERATSLSTLRRSRPVESPLSPEWGTSSTAPAKRPCEASSKDPPRTFVPCHVSPKSYSPQTSFRPITKGMALFKWENFISEFITICKVPDLQDPAHKNHPRTSPFSSSFDLFGCKEFPETKQYIMEMAHFLFIEAWAQIRQIWQFETHHDWASRESSPPALFRVHKDIRPQSGAGTLELSFICVAPSPSELPRKGDLLIILNPDTMSSEFCYVNKAKELSQAECHSHLQLAEEAALRVPLDKTHFATADCTLSMLDSFFRELQVPLLPIRYLRFASFAWDMHSFEVLPLHQIRTSVQNLADLQERKETCGEVREMVQALSGSEMLMKKHFSMAEPDPKFRRELKLPHTVTSALSQRQEMLVRSIVQCCLKNMRQVKICLFEGGPATGKTTVLAAVIKVLSLAKLQPWYENKEIKTVIFAPTNSSVSAICEKLRTNSGDLQVFSIKTMEDLDILKRPDQFSVVAVDFKNTWAKSDIRDEFVRVGKNLFQVAVVDDAQGCGPEALGIAPIIFGVQKLIIAGDSLGLRLNQVSSFSGRQQLGIPLFDRLCVLLKKRSMESVLTKTQFRSHPKISQVAMKLRAYHLKCQVMRYEVPKVVFDQLEQYNIKPVVVLGVGKGDESTDLNVTAAKVAESVDYCLRETDPGKDHRITVLVVHPVPLNRFTKAQFRAVDDMQGQEADVVIFPIFPQTPLTVRQLVSSFTRARISVIVINNFVIMSDDDWGFTVSTEAQGNSQSSSYEENEAFRKKKVPQNATGLWIEQGKISRIIGRGGSKIKELREQSGARIKVTDDKDNYGDTLVLIWGSQEEQEKAKTLIDEILDPYLALAAAAKQKKEEEEPIENIDFGALYKESCNVWREKWEKEVPVLKGFYIEDPEVANMTPRDVEMLRKQMQNMSVHTIHEELADVHVGLCDMVNEEPPEEVTVPNPVWTFEQAWQHYPEILSEIKKQGFASPSPIQCQMWPLVLSGSDVIGVSQTGSGKTIAFLLPALVHIDKQPTPRKERAGPDALILAPTRELALQIAGEVKKYSYHGIKSACIIGGESRNIQIEFCQSGIEIAIATPGRLTDLVCDGHLDITTVSFLVLDEADRMLDMGFEPQIRRICCRLRPDRQTIMTSATWPTEVRRIAKMFLRNPLRVVIGTLDLTACHDVQQVVEIIPEEEKFDYTMEFMRNIKDDPAAKVLIFCGRRTSVDNLASELNCKGYDVESLHGGHEQESRESSLNSFRVGDVRCLVATDVAARGIDVIDITHIINYDFPREMEEYVHRVGRTGRAGRSGMAISLMTREDWKQARPLIAILTEASQEVPPGLHEMAERYESMLERRAREGPIGGGGGGGTYVEEGVEAEVEAAAEDSVAAEAVGEGAAIAVGRMDTGPASAPAEVEVPVEEGSAEAEGGGAAAVGEADPASTEEASTEALFGLLLTCVDRGELEILCSSFEWKCL